MKSDSVNPVKNVEVWACIALVFVVRRILNRSRDIVSVAADEPLRFIGCTFSK